VPRWEPDGTQPPPPPPVWDDPVAGLVTGDTYRAEQPVTVKVIVPEMPDLSEVRAAVESAFLDDEPPAPAATPAKRASPPIREPHDTPGMVPSNPRPGWPRSPSVRLAGLRKPAERLPPPRGVPRRNPGAAVGALFGLIVVIGVVLWLIISIIAGIVDSISGIFN
jgi:hypothetical protein